MTEPTDRAVALLQRVSELLFESRAISRQLEGEPQKDAPSGYAAERVAYGILVATLEEGLVTTLQRAMEVLKRFSAPAGVVGEQWLGEQEKLLRPPSD